MQVACGCELTAVLCENDDVFCWRNSNNGLDEDNLLRHAAEEIHGDKLAFVSNFFSSPMQDDQPEM